MKNPGEIVHAQGIERGDYGQPPDDLGNQPEPFEVFRLHLSKQPISRHLAVFRHLTEAEAAPPETHGDDLFQTYERSAADEQDVGRVEGDAGLLRVLVAAKRWHSGDRAFEKLRAPKKMKRMERRSHAHAMDESPVWRISHGQATCQRRTLATHRTALASTQASSLPVPRRKPLDYRKVLTGIIFVLKTGIPWEELPQEMGCGCGMTCLNYLNAWQRAGVWEKLHQILLAELEQADKLDWSRAAVDSAKARALGGGDQTGPNPTDRGKPGTKHHVLTEGQGVPLVTHSTGANVPDVNELLPLVDDIPPVRRKADRPRGVPDNLYADRAYDSQPHRQELEARGIDPHLARRRTEHGSGLGVYRWVAERTLSWLHSFRRLRLRTDREGPVHDAFVSLASALICMWFL